MTTSIHRLGRVPKTLAKSSCVLFLAASSVLPVAAGSYRWNDDTTFHAGRIWLPPNEGLTEVSTESAAYTRLTVWVDEPGEYTVSSSQSFDGMVLIYEGQFDPQLPLQNAIAANDDAGPFESSLTMRLAAGVLYVVVITGKNPSDVGMVAGSVGGPGEVRPSSCFIGDEVFFFDSNTELALAPRRFCVYVEWNDSRGNSGFGKPVGYRTENSGQFWFFDPSNFEMQVKVLDGCAVNGHYWVFYSATTNVGFTLTVDDLWLVHPSRRYSNPVGQTASTITDTSAFPCALP